MTTILGISAYYHDSAGALVCDGVIVAAAQEERFTRKKHDHAFPANAVRYCLKQAGVDIEDVDYVVFYDKPFLKFERLLETYVAFAPRGLLSFLKAMPLWLQKKLWMRSLISKELGCDAQKIKFAYHHESHAASAFYPSPFDEAAIITMDGVGEWQTTSIGEGRGNSIRLIKEINFPHSLGLLYSAFTYFTGFKVNSGEYKLMGLAPYGEPRYVDMIKNNIIDIKNDGSFNLNLDYFNYCVGLTMTNDKFSSLFDGPPRKSEGQVTQREMDLARSIQVVTEEVIVKMAKTAKQITGMKYLCLAGGVALNCVANGRLLKQGIFDDIWIQPAAGDAGGALGCALSLWYQHLKNPRECDGTNDKQNGSYLGPAIKSNKVKDFLDKRNIPYVEFNDTNSLHERLADLMVDENVIGICRGPMEFGPRALGNRSIIGDARSERMQSTMNLKIKYRESFRPFAPSVLEAAAPEYFKIDKQVKSPYMLLVADVADKHCIPMTSGEERLFGIEKLNVRRSAVPAITHVDYSARLQTVSRVTNPEYYDLIDVFYKKTGCPVIINTSFNVRGEPIVCSHEDAYRCFMRTGMDYLVLDKFLLAKKNQPKLNNDVDWRKEFELD